MPENLTQEMILQRMLDRVANNVDKREGAIIWDASASAAVEFKLLYIESDDVMDEAFADTASREFLIRRAAERDIKPDPATYAVLRGEFSPSTIDILGQVFRMPNRDIRYTATEKIIDGVYYVRCETVGTEGNHYLGRIIPVEYIDGLQTAELTALEIPAQDEEETEHLRQRYFDSFDAQAFGGNVADYLRKTNSIDGVGATKVTPVWNGGGTVKLTILDALYNPASSVLIDAVQTAIDPIPNNGVGLGLAPIGHIVTVDTVQGVTVNVQTNVTLDVGYTWDTVRPQVISSLQTYLFGLRGLWANEDYLVVYLSQIVANIVSVPGIVDATGTTLNGTTNNLTLDSYEVPVWGGISI